jgi:hypothetical protein
MKFYHMSSSSKSKSPKKSFGSISSVSTFSNYLLVSGYVIAFWTTWYKSKQYVTLASKADWG